MEEVVVGIDLGTTNTYGAAVINGNLEMEHFIYNRPCLIYNDNNITVVTSISSLYKLKQPKNSIFDVKRFIGRNYSNHLLKQICKNYPFEIVNIDGDIRFKIKLSNEECYKSPEDVCSEVLKGFNKLLSSKIDSDIIAKAVLTVPAYFTTKQRQAMMEAAELAEINVICLLEEPIAAFIGHLDQVKDTNGLSMVFHLGGCTFDTSILEYSGCEIVVKCIDGDNMLGGDNLDKVINDYFVDVYKICDLNYWRLAKFEIDCLVMKCNLSFETVQQRVSNSYENDSRITLDLSRKKFEEIADPLFKRCMDIVKRCLTKNNINKRDIKNIILVGGSTRIPKIKELLLNFFEDSKIIQSINPEHTVAIGAALYGHIYKTPFAKKLVPTTSNF